MELAVRLGLKRRLTPAEVREYQRNSIRKALQQQRIEDEKERARKNKRRLKKLKRIESHSQRILQNCVRAMTQAAKRGYDSVNVAVRISKVLYFKSGHWEAILRGLSDYGYAVSTNGAKLTFEVTSRIREMPTNLLWRDSVAGWKGAGPMKHWAHHGYFTIEVSD